MLVFFVVDIESAEHVLHCRIRPQVPNAQIQTKDMVQATVGGFT